MTYSKQLQYVQWDVHGKTWQQYNAIVDLLVKEDIKPYTDVVFELAVE